MKTVAEFGFVTGCHAGDKVLVQATLASMRHYCPNVPICLVADGGVDVRDLENAYNLHVLRTGELANTAMRDICCGSYHAKMAAIWEGPFDFMVWLDSDAIVWGDFTKLIRTDVDFHILWRQHNPPEGHHFTSSPGFAHYFFDAAALHRLDPSFSAEGHTYFCSGAFGCRRNSIPFDQWREIYRWDRANPGLFAWGEMGMLNYAVHSAAQRGKLMTATTDIQDLWVESGTAEFEADCRGAKWRFPSEISRPRVAHFCGRKPFVCDKAAYSKPFTIARLEHYRRLRGSAGAWQAVLCEEARIVSGKVSRRLWPTSVLRTGTKSS